MTSPATAPTTATIHLDADDVTRFRMDGWWHADAGIVPQHELAQVRDIYDRLFADQAGRAGGKHFALFGDERKPDQPMVHQILGPELLAPELTATCAWANARAVLTGLLGRTPEHMSGHAIRKPAHSPLATPWHQDEAYWGPRAYHLSISLWIPLQDVDQRSGCMHFVPGSHLGDILPHRLAGNDPRAQGLELDGADFDLSNQVAVPLRAGGCTAHGGRMLHYTTPNHADVPRRAWIITGGIAAPPRRIAATLPWLAQMQAARDAAAAEALSRSA
jgi:hypothetical protein